MHKDDSGPMASDCKGVSFGTVNVIEEDDAVL